MKHSRRLHLKVQDFRGLVDSEAHDIDRQLPFVLDIPSTINKWSLKVFKPVPAPADPNPNVPARVPARASACPRVARKRARRATRSRDAAARRRISRRARRALRRVLQTLVNSAWHRPSLRRATLVRRLICCPRMIWAMSRFLRLPRFSTFPRASLPTLDLSMISAVSK